MRRAMTMRHNMTTRHDGRRRNGRRLAARLCACLLWGGLLLPAHGPRAEEAEAPEPRHRLLWARGESALPASGPHARANAAALARMAAAVRRFGGPGVSFALATGTPDCGGVPACDAKTIRDRRFRDAMAEIRKAVEDSDATPFRGRIAFAAPQELGGGVTLPPAPDGAEAMHLFLVAEGEGGQPAGCQARVLLRDPEAPPVVGGAARLGALPLPPGARTAVGAGAAVAVAPGRGASRPALAVWENGRGEFRRAGVAAGDGFAAVPAGAARLHLLFPQSETDPLAAFYGGLSEEFHSASRPALLTAAAQEERARFWKRRGVGNGVGSHKDGTIKGPRRLPEAADGSLSPAEAETLACHFEISR